jgi:hypothetical protein
VNDFAAHGYGFTGVRPQLEALAQAIDLVELGLATLGDTDPEAFSHQAMGDKVIPFSHHPVYSISDSPYKLCRVLRG